MNLRYKFRLYPTPGQQAALARAFGCARVVFNDAIAARQDAYEAGEKFPSAAELSERLITDAKRACERSWLGDVSSVVLQQALRDVDRAYSNFFDSISRGDLARRSPCIQAR
ncbi:RNA-guided endonuclease InsQ/TnpB family protein [Saccharopolyspora mangrovi]|uniref:Transposase n=1 Tax=Saccharopolyspora mangrovi TaxID=3082379 RepID=A0ABU6A628_9PSEU|nr:transposase [Saccharopolyspora sp. S2-29]MEB3367014.1 transposase [Saccharopolyspora sp. S2-29]